MHLLELVSNYINQYTEDSIRSGKVQLHSEDLFDFYRDLSTSDKQKIDYTFYLISGMFLKDMIEKSDTTNE